MPCFINENDFVPGGPLSAQRDSRAPIEVRRT